MVYAEFPLLLHMAGKLFRRRVVNLFQNYSGSGNRQSASTARKWVVPWLHPFCTLGEAHGGFPSDFFPTREMGVGAMWQFAAKTDGKLNEGSIPFTNDWQ
jgi:hypothetical protein